MSAKIDFLGIGAQKAGTSWLWENLRDRFNIRMPPRKELHYFDRSPRYPSDSHLASKYLSSRLFGKKRYHKDFRDKFRNELWEAVKKRNGAELGWVLRYFLGKYGDDWYLSLFRGENDAIKGEITPSYSMLDLEDVKRIRNMFPDLKIILLLRNPIDRAWSQVRFLSMIGRFDGIGDVDNIKDFIDIPEQSLRSDYIRTIDIWSSCFPGEQIFIDFYDRIIQEPDKLILDILKFLGAETTSFTTTEKLRIKVNSSPEMIIPMEIKRYLAGKYHPELEKLSNLLGGYSEIWLKDTEIILNQI